MHFSNKLEATISRNSSLLIVGLDPNPEMMPTSYGDRSSQDALIESLRDWSQWIIDQTKDLVCAYKPTLGFYQALGSSGLELLQDIPHSIPSHIPVILDAKHSDIQRFLDE